MKGKSAVYILMGPMGCGKTTLGKGLSQKLGWPFYDGDDFHPAENKEKMRAGIPLTDEDRLPWLERLRDEIREWLGRDGSALLACSALKKAYRDILGVDQMAVFTIFLKGSRELLQDRVMARRHPYMAKSLLQSQLDALEEPEGGLIVDIAPPPGAVVESIVRALEGRRCGQIPTFLQPSPTSNRIQGQTDMKKSDIGLIGLAVMGENLALNMESKGFTVTVYNRTLEKVNRFIEGRGKGKRIVGARSIPELIETLSSPRKIMLMVKAGPAVDAGIDQLAPYLDEGDVIIDGGNSHYPDTERRTRRLESMGLLYIGAGVSGGEEGALKGPSIMPGGSPGAWESVRPVFEAIAARVEGDVPCCRWIGEGGAGHFVKMVHNGIEYGDMQLICESYQIMRTLLDMTTDEMSDVFRQWNRGDLASYLIEITGEILAYKDEAGDPVVEKILDAAGQKGTGKWTGVSALDLGVPLTLIGESVFARHLSARKEERVAASQILEGPAPRFSGDSDAFLRDMEQALFASKIVSYAQGLALMKAASGQYGWRLNYADIALVWRGGCIIRSAFLDSIAAAYKRSPDLSNMLLDDFFRTKLRAAQDGWRRVVAGAVHNGVSIPAMSSALCYYDGLRTENLPANLLQAQRDYFGAHTYERIDMPRGRFFHTDWTGEGGDTTSTVY